MITTNYTNILTGEPFTGPVGGRVDNSLPSGSTAYEVSGAATIAIGFYNGEVLRLCVECTTSVSSTLERHRPRWRGTTMGSTWWTEDQPKYTIWQETHRSISARYKYFWLLASGQKEYLVDSEVHYAGITHTRDEVDTKIFTSSIYDPVLVLRHGGRAYRSYVYTEKTIGSSIVCVSADASRKIAIFRKVVVDSPVTARSTPATKFAFSPRVRYHFQIWQDTRAEALAMVVTMMRGEISNIVEIPEAIIKPPPEAELVRPACKIYLYAYLPNGRVYRERIKEVPAYTGSSEATVDALWGGEDYTNLYTTGMPEFSQGGSYVPIIKDGMAIAMQPTLIGTAYAVKGGHMDVSLGESPLVLPSVLVPNYPIPDKTDTNEAEVAHATQQRDADWPGNGYLSAPLYGGLPRNVFMAIPSKLAGP